MKHFKLLSLLLFFSTAKLLAQDLNWATVPYTAGSLSADFGVIGASPTHVTLQITPTSPIPGDEPGFGPGFPAKYSAVTAAAPCTPDICALRSVVFFNTSTGSAVDYTFTFSPAVCGLTFNLLDIDGNTNQFDPGDLATITAVNGVVPQNINLTSLDPGAQIITGNGTTSVTVTGDNNNTTDERTRVTIAGCVTQVTIRYQCQGVDIGRSFSITNMTWPSAGPLPVKLISFSGKKQNNTVQLKWATENAINLDYFGVERSVDGINFRTIGTVSQNGGRNGIYTFADAEPFATNSFYRLRQVDADGRFEYSPVVLIKAGNKNNVLTIFPNPATSDITISTGENEVIQHLAIFDVNGKRLMDQNKPSSNRIDISALPTGFYKIKIETATGGKMTSSFIKH